MFDLGPAVRRPGPAGPRRARRPARRADPVPEWSLADLLAHVHQFARVFTANAHEGCRRHRPTACPTTGAPSSRSGSTSWPRAWRDPAAWQGRVSAGGVEMTGEENAVVAIEELVVHGWDVARASGQDFEPAAGVPRPRRAVPRHLRRAARVRDRAPTGRRSAAGADASRLERYLAAAGRDPAWSARAYSLMTVSSNVVAVNRTRTSTSSPTAGTCGAVGQEQHRGLHVRRLGEQPLLAVDGVRRAHEPGRVEAALGDPGRPVLQRGAAGGRLEADAVRRAAGHHQDRAGRRGGAAAVAVDVAALDRVHVEHGRPDPQRGAVAEPELGADPGPELVVRVGLPQRRRARCRSGARRRPGGWAARRRPRRSSAGCTSVRCEPWEIGRCTATPSTATPST